MRQCPFDPSLSLLDVSDVAGVLPPEFEAHAETLRRLVDWARQYLCQPHGDLGRPGPVCPYVAASLNRRLFLLTVEPDERPDVAAVIQAARVYGRWFVDIEPRSGIEAQYKTILILFPKLAPSEMVRVIEGTQADLKAEFVDKGLMIGEFHAGPPGKPGLWNPDFRPLYSPVPLLSIRHMVPTDFPFLTEDARYVAAYLRQFGHSVPPHLRDTVDRAARTHGLAPQ